MQKFDTHSFPLVWFILLWMLLPGCHEKEQAPIYQVPADIEPYIKTFLAEAKLRGKEIHLNNLILEFGTQGNEDICGECVQVPGKPDHQKRIIISNESICWSDAAPLVREGLIFHELGHCILGRIHHKDAHLSNGDFASLMNTNQVNVYGPCEYDLGGGNACDQSFKRQYYLDELFDENTPVPDWAK